MAGSLATVHRGRSVTLRRCRCRSSPGVPGRICAGHGRPAGLGPSDHLVARDRPGRAGIPGTGPRLGPGPIPLARNRTPIAGRLAPPGGRGPPRRLGTSRTDGGSPVRASPSIPPPGRYRRFRGAALASGCRSAARPFGSARCLGGVEASGPGRTGGRHGRIRDPGVEPVVVGPGPAPPDRGLDVPKADHPGRVLAVGNRGLHERLDGAEPRTRGLRNALGALARTRCGGCSAPAGLGPVGLVGTLESAAEIPFGKRSEPLPRRRRRESFSETREQPFRLTEPGRISRRKPP